jgi:hypothetical protein
VRWLATAALIFQATPAVAAIVHVQIPVAEQQFFSLGNAQTRDFDFDQDGRVDIQFAGSFSGFAVRSMHQEAGILTANMIGGNFFGKTAVPLLYGELITAYQELPFGASRGITAATANVYLLSYGALDGGSGGIWYNQEAYMGFALFDPIVDGQFDKLHYGWLHLREFGGLGAYFLEYGYETEADVPIFAGQVPEPSSSILTVLGMTWFMRRRRPYTRTSPAPARSGFGRDC